MDVTKVDFNRVFADAVAAYDLISAMLIQGDFEASVGETFVRARQGVIKAELPTSEAFMEAKQAGQFGPRIGFSAFEMHVLGLAIGESIKAVMRTETAKDGLKVAMIFSQAAHTVFDRAVSQEVHAARQAAIAFVSIRALKSTAAQLDVKLTWPDVTPLRSALIPQ